jgi:hypothetical protein
VELEIPFHLAPMVPTATPAGSQAKLVE